MPLRLATLELGGGGAVSRMHFREYNGGKYKKKIHKDVNAKYVHKQKNIYIIWAEHKENVTSRIIRQSYIISKREHKNRKLARSS